MLCATGCFHVHGEGNAPAHVSLEEPPEERVAEVDPGEHVVVLGAGVLGGIGLMDDGFGIDAGALLALEASLHVGQSETSHSEDGMVWPQRALGVNTGLSFGLFDREPSRGTGYVELQVISEGGALAGGWAFPVLRDARGPQVTLSFGPFFLRGAWLIDDGGEFSIGTAIKPWGVFTRSR